MNNSEQISEKYIPLYRVQGGQLPRASRKTISIKNGKLDFNLSHRNDYTYIGTAEHMKYFFKMRAHIIEPLDKLFINHKDNLNEQLPVNNVEVITMFVPEWYQYLLTSLATVTSKKTRPLEPLLVDKRTPR